MPPTHQPGRRAHRPTWGLAILAALGAAAAARAADPAPSPAALDLDEAAAVERRMDADPVLAQARAACPADVFGRLDIGRLMGLVRQPVPQDVCARDPGGCLDRCLDQSDVNGCMSLARVLEANQPDVPPRYAPMLYARGCALGNASGCTNRASGISYHHLPDDPLMQRPAASRERCEFRTYEASCGGGDAWGCSMLGRAYRTGTGTTADAGAARRHYEETCRMAPDHSACDDARDGLTELGDAGR